MTPSIQPVPPTSDQSDDREAFAVSVSDAEDGVITVAVRGDVDMLTAPAVAAAVERAQAGHSVVLNLDDVSFIGSVGLSLLVDAARRAEGAEHKFAILAGNRIVLRAVQVTGLDSTLHIFADRAEAAPYLEQ